MKRHLFNYILVLSVGMASCSKSQDVTPMDDADISSCETCVYTFQAKAQLDNFRIESGKALVFTYKEYWGSDYAEVEFAPYNVLHFQIPANSKTFSYRKPDINSNNVFYGSVCSFCNLMPTYATDGYINGKQVSQNRWLVDAEVIITSPQSEHTDTLRFKQYFTPHTDRSNP